MKTSKLWLRNTSRYTDAEIWPLIKTAYESVERSLTSGQVMPRIIVKLTNCRYPYRGRAHWIEYEHPKENYSSSICWHRILVRIGTPANFPKQVRYPRFKSDMPQYECRTYHEAIVMVTAHEIEHCLGASGRMNGEFHCEIAAWDAIDYYRKHQPKVEQEITDALNRITQREQAQVLKITEAKRPEVQLIKKMKAAQEALAKWQRKSKLATGKVKKYSQAVKRYQKKLAKGAVTAKQFNDCAVQEDPE